MADKKQQLNLAYQKWVNAVDDIQDDIESLLEGRNITKAHIADDMWKMKAKLQTLEINLKTYR